MRLNERYFNEYYERYIVLELDDLTEMCKAYVDVTQDDCYGLCAPKIHDDGIMYFEILAIGSTFDTCTKGLELDEILGEVQYEDVMECESWVVPTQQRYLEKLDVTLLTTTEDQQELRLDARLDHLRDLQYPDTVYVHTLHAHDERIPMELKRVHGPFLIVAMPYQDETLGIDQGEELYVLPFDLDGEMELMALFAKKQLTKESQEVIESLVLETDKIGFDFFGLRHERS